MVSKTAGKAGIGEDLPSMEICARGSTRRPPAESFLKPGGKQPFRVRRQEELKIREPQSGLSAFGKPHVSNIESLESS